MGHNLGILGFNEDDLKTFRPYGLGNIEVWVVFVIENSIKLPKKKKKVLEEKYSWVTGSNLG